mmetsp:Transcript_28414/g.60886  ORF Transcript_28414/g.60886 Transcript_28414/m.60886 type:complete len:303 (-) Transcript_28414:431-1339(-)
MNGLGDIFQVLVVQSCKTNAPVLCEIDGVLIGELVAHIGVHSRVSKHSYLFRHMGPIVRATNHFKGFNESRSHGLDSFGHPGTFGVVLLRELIVRQDSSHNGRAVLRGTAVHGTDDALQLAHQNIFLGGILAHDTQCSASLTVQTKVFGEGLRQKNGETGINNSSESLGICFGITRGETLVGTVEKDQVSLRLDYFQQLLPLLVRRIATGWVVRTGMKQQDGSIRGILEILQHALKIETVGRAVVITVSVYIQAASAEDFVVVSPGWIWDINILVGIEIGQELASDPASSRSTEGLNSGNSF